MNASDVIVIYPGRFHPFHKGHKGVYDLLNGKFKNVYIATSDKVEADKSPFSFDEKVEIMNLTGVPTSDILKVRQTYNGNEYMSRFDNSYGLIFAVSEKDMLDDPRFNFPASGQSLKKDGSPAYLQKFTDLNSVEEMSKHGYIMTVPTTSFKVGGHDVNSASQIRTMLGSENIDDAKQAFVDLYDKYNETVFKTIRNKLGKNTMENIDLNELRKLAGLNELDIEKDDDYSDVPGYKEKPMFDQLGKIIDSYDMSQDGDDIKNPLSTVKTDDGEEMEVSVGEARALKDMMEMLSSARMGEEKSAREKFLDSIQKSEGLHSMLEFARSKGLVKEEYTGEGNAFGGAQVGKKKGDKFTVGGKTFTKEEEIEELDLNDIRADFGVEEGKMKDVAMDMADEFYDKVARITDNTNDIGQAVVDAWDDTDENPPEWALDDEARQILIDAGKIGPEQEEPDMEEAAKPDYIDLDGDGDRVETMRKAAKDKANKRKKEESFDPQAEQSREDEAYEELMNAYQQGGEEGLCKAIGCTERDLSDQIEEIGREKGLHADDDRDEIIQIYVEELVDNADWKDHGETDHDMEEDLNRMRHLAGNDNITEVNWNWQSGSYDKEAGYDNNFSLWRDEAMRDRSNFGAEPFKSEEEMHKSFQDSMKSMGIDIFKQKQISMAKKQQKDKEERERYSSKPEQTSMDF